MSALRPLPPRPSLEYEHKEAKALLRRLRAGDPKSLARARERHSPIDVSAPDRIQLSDAQLVIAREYGFVSWPKLVAYFGDVERQRHYHREVHSREPEQYERRARRLIDDHRERREWAAVTVAAYVPRFYGMRNGVFEQTLTEDEARLAVARTDGFSSWAVLLDRLREGNGRHWDRLDHRWEVDPMRYAGEAMQAADLDQLRCVIDAHPGLLHPSPVEAAKGYSLMASAIAKERVNGREAMRPIIEWLVQRGIDFQRELNKRLIGPMRNIDDVRYLLERGADPNWVAPNGFTVLEHALLRYWDGDMVDLVAARAKPRKSLWIAAGLGDIDGVRRSLDRHGKPTPAARRLRADFDAIGPMTMPMHPDATDDEILIEALFVAVLNGRTKVIEYLISRGCPVDGLMMGMPVIATAIGSGTAETVETLVRCGANLDLSGWQPGYSARQLTRELFLQTPQDPDRRRKLEACGMSPDVVLAEHDARPVNAPGVSQRLKDALELAGDDAFRLNQPDIRPDNLLYGLLRGRGMPPLLFTQAIAADLDRFRADQAARLRPFDERVERPKLPLNAHAQAMIQAAIAVATERRRDAVEAQHLLLALTRAETGPAADLLARYGSSAAALTERLMQSQSL